MKTRNRTKKFLASLVALGMVASIWTSWGARPAQAARPIVGKTGLFGITEGQTVRVSILNAQARGGIVPETGIFNMGGNEIARRESSAPLSQGQGTFFDFDAGSLGLRAGQRAQILVRVVLEQPPDPCQPPDPGQPPDPCQPPDPARPGDAMVTVEVFDNASGKTMFVIPATLEGFNPQPEPPRG